MPLRWALDRFIDAHHDGDRESHTSTVGSKGTLFNMWNATGGNPNRINQHTVFTTTQPGNPGSVKPITPKPQPSTRKAGAGLVAAG